MQTLSLVIMMLWITITVIIQQCKKGKCIYLVETASDQHWLSLDDESLSVALSDVSQNKRKLPGLGFCINLNILHCGIILFYSFTRRAAACR